MLILALKVSTKYPYVVLGGGGVQKAKGSAYVIYNWSLGNKKKVTQDTQSC